jgi:hypothetical protein
MWPTTDGAPSLDVGYDLYVPGPRGGRSRVAIGAGTRTLEDALAGDPWSKIILDLNWLGTNGELPLPGHGEAPA